MQEWTGDNFNRIGEGRRRERKTPHRLQQRVGDPGTPELGTRLALGRAVPVAMNERALVAAAAATEAATTAAAAVTAAATLTLPSVAAATAPAAVSSAVPTAPAAEVVGGHARGAESLRVEPAVEGLW